MQDHPAKQLDVEMPLPECPDCGFPDCCEGLDHDRVKRFAGLDPLAEFIRLRL